MGLVVCWKWKLLVLLFVVAFWFFWKQWLKASLSMRAVVCEGTGTTFWIPSTYEWISTQQVPTKGLALIVNDSNSSVYVTSIGSRQHVPASGEWISARETLPLRIEGDLWRRRYSDGEKVPSARHCDHHFGGFDVEHFVEFQHTSGACYFVSHVHDRSTLYRNSRRCWKFCFENEEENSLCVWVWAHWCTFHGWFVQQLWIACFLFEHASGAPWMKSQWGVLLEECHWVVCCWIGSNGGSHWCSECVCLMIIGHVQAALWCASWIRCCNACKICCCNWIDLSECIKENSFVFEVLLRMGKRWKWIARQKMQSNFLQVNTKTIPKEQQIELLV